MATSPNSAPGSQVSTLPTTCAPAATRGAPSLLGGEPARTRVAAHSARSSARGRDSRPSAPKGGYEPRSHHPTPAAAAAWKEVRREAEPARSGRGGGDERGEHLPPRGRDPRGSRGAGTVGPDAQWVGSLTDTRGISVCLPAAGPQRCGHLCVYLCGLPWAFFALVVQEWAQEGTVPGRTHGPESSIFLVVDGECASQSSESITLSLSSYYKYRKVNKRPKDSRCPGPERGEQ